VRSYQVGIDNPAAAKPAAEAMHRGECFLCRHRVVGGFCRIEAKVALAASLDRGLTKIAAHGGRAAAGTIEHGIELAHLARLHGLHRAVDVPHVDTPQRPQGRGRF
jgi:hypothetical protein